jgi:hypothetical protein
MSKLDEMPQWVLLVPFIPYVALLVIIFGLSWLLGGWGG